VGREYTERSGIRMVVDGQAHKMGHLGSRTKAAEECNDRLKNFVFATFPCPFFSPHRLSPSPSSVKRGSHSFVCQSVLSTFALVSSLLPPSCLPIQ